jgi:hypothetical protein
MIVKAQRDLLIIVIAEEFNFRRQTTTKSVATSMFIPRTVLFAALLKNGLINTSTCLPFEILDSHVDERLQYSAM